MEKKLELKHLAAYLPYDVQVNFKGQFMYLCLLNLEVCYKYKDKYIFKPFLRPLSDLTKEIEFNGENITPLKYLFENKFYTTNLAFSDAISDIQVYKLDNVRYGIIEILLSWHFDIFGLIDSGLAIDINTLEKQ